MDSIDNQLNQLQELCNKVIQAMEKNEELTRQHSTMKKEIEASKLKE